MRTGGTGGVADAGLVVEDPADPKNAFVAGFIGSPAMNLGTFTIADGHALIGGAKVPLPRSTVSAVKGDKGDKVQVGFRPEVLELSSEDDPGSFPVEALVIEELGSDAFLYGNLIGDDLVGDHIVARIAPRSVPAKGAKVWLKIAPGRIHAFDVDSGLALPTD